MPRVGAIIAIIFVVLQYFRFRSVRRPIEDSSNVVESVVEIDEEMTLTARALKKRRKNVTWHSCLFAILISVVSPIQEKGTTDIAFNIKETDRPFTAAEKEG